MGEQLRDAVWEALLGFRKALEEIHGKGLYVKGETEQSNSSVPAGSAPSIKFHGIFEEDGANATLVRSEDGAPITTTTTSYRDVVSFQAHPQDLFDVLTTPDKVRAWSRAAVTGSFGTGASFTLFDGNVSGRVVAAEAPRLLQMEWRLKNWSEHTPPSIVSLLFKETTDGCRVELSQTGIPASDLEAIKTNWTHHYWNPIKAIFGFGRML